MRRLVLLVLLLLMSATATAKLYKWVDKDGNVTYSERKPPDNQAEEVKLRGVSAVSGEESRERLDQLSNKADTPRKDRKFKQTTSSESAERDARLAENCETARQNLRVLESARRVQADGGEFLDAKSRAARMKKTQEEIQNSCNN
jgi:hypothetical protein